MHSILCFIKHANAYELTILPFLEVQVKNTNMIESTMVGQIQKNEISHFMISYITSKSNEDVSKIGRRVMSFNVHLSVRYSELMISSSWCQLLPKYHKVLAKKEYMCHPYLIFVNFCTKPHYSGL